MAGVRFADLQSRPTEFLDVTGVTLEEFQTLVPPLRPRSTRIWRRDASMGNPGPPAGFPWTKTAPCRRQKIGSCFSSPPSRPTPSRWCTGACSGWSRAKRISGSTCSCPRCAPSAMPLPVP